MNRVCTSTTLPRAHKHHRTKINLEDSIRQAIDVSNKEGCTDEQMNNNKCQTTAGGCIDDLIGCRQMRCFPKLVYMTESGLGIYKHVLKSHRRNLKMYCIGGNLDALTRVKTILGKQVTATLLARTEELNSEDARFDGHMRSTILHH